jgi:poly(A) polymerase
MSTPKSSASTVLRDRAASVAGRLIAAGHEAVFAGGCVRDRLLGLTPREYDIATSATPEEIRAVFPRAVGVGEAFGVMLLRERDATFENATFRSDQAYEDGRRPTGVVFTDAAEDARRRDFTINGLFEDPRSGEVIDHVGGIEDLEQRVLRAIGDPRQRLAEDRLRAIRAVRFAAGLALRVDPATDEAIVALGGDLGGICCERLGQELRRILAHPSRSMAVDLFERWSLDVPLLGSHRRGGHPRVESLPEDASMETALAAWLLDRESDPSSDPAGRAAALQQRLGLSNREREMLSSIVRLHGSLADWETASVATRRRLAMEEAFEAARSIVAAEDEGDARRIQLDLEAFGVERHPERWVRGQALLDAGIPPGPRLGRVLEATFDAQLEGRVSTPDEAVRFALDLARGNPDQAS